jgi:hypothetical protein
VNFVQKYSGYVAGVCMLVVAAHYYIHNDQPAALAAFSAGLGLLGIGNFLRKNADATPNA